MKRIILFLSIFGCLIASVNARDLGQWDAVDPAKQTEMGQIESDRSRHRILESCRLRVLLRAARGRLIRFESRSASGSNAQIACKLLVVESARSRALTEQMDGNRCACAISTVQGVSLAGRIGTGSGANSMLPDSPVRNDKSSGPPPVGSPPGAAEGRNVETSDGPSGAGWPLPAPKSAARPPCGWPFMISSRAASTLAASAAE